MMISLNAKHLVHVLYCLITGNLSLFSCLSRYGHRPLNWLIKLGIGHIYAFTRFQITWKNQNFEQIPRVLGVKAVNLFIRDNQPVFSWLITCPLRSVCPKWENVFEFPWISFEIRALAVDTCTYWARGMESRYVSFRINISCETYIVQVWLVKKNQKEFRKQSYLAIFLLIILDRSSVPSK